MIVRAPGKLVLSGAYAVLEGAPALVAAVDRYVLADPERPAEHETEEVRAAIAAGALDRAVWFDASALRAEQPVAVGGEGAGTAAAAPERRASRKLGIGSSAAILVATLAARARRAGAPASAPGWDTARIFADALAAHRRAQGGGSGVDVAASVYGGVLCCRLAPGGELAVTPHALPAGLVIEVFASESSARTSVMLERVRALAAREPEAHRALLGAAAEGANAAVRAADVAAFVTALDRQVDALAALGDRAGAPIVTPELRRLRLAAAAEGAAFAPSGAGGGDVALFVGGAPPSAAFVAAARASRLEREVMSIGAPGVHVLDAAHPPHA
ncbi:GHMP family kinase ATP-binding protein [Sorangium sp. So ce131]|uniref:GHMP family kinase ATP-binding protein n=1 Tax=Sorangium sp. So ce131 TaxID=3133282 RepID=UPI003F615A75